MTLNVMQAYTIGETDTRPWGGYQVTAVSKDDQGNDVVEKIITVNPKKMLSLQSHEGRAEVWTAVKGTLTAVVNDQIVTAHEGQSIDLPRGTIHAMVNAGDTPIQVHEVQRGICREDDIIRYYDQSGRDVAPPDAPEIQASISTYKTLMGTL